MTFCDLQANEIMGPSQMEPPSNLLAPVLNILYSNIFQRHLHSLRAPKLEGPYDAAYTSLQDNPVLTVGHTLCMFIMKQVKHSPIGAITVLIVWQLDLQLPVQPVPIEFLSGKVYSMQQYVITFVSDWRQVDGFLSLIWFPPPIKLKLILLKVASTPSISLTHSSI